MTRASTHPTTAAASLALRQAVARRAGGRARGARTPNRYTGWAQAALVWLLLALVVVPTVGRLHQVLHAKVLSGQVAHLVPGVGTSLHGFATASASVALPVPVQAANAGSAQGLATDVAQPTHSPHAQRQGLFLDLLLAHHAPVDCLLLDQLALGDALHSVPAALAAPVPAQAPQVHPAATAAVRHVALFQARGPPLMA